MILGTASSCDSSTPTTETPSHQPSAGEVPGTLRVLLVDDEPLVTDALAGGLRRQFHVDCARSASEALAVLAGNDVDVIVSDEQMPGTSGCKLLAQVRRLWPSTMRVMLSGHADLRSTLEAINDAHVFRFLTKPCSVEDVAFCIRQAVAARQELVDDGRRERLPAPPPDLERFESAIDLLWMAYQPVVDARTSKVVAYEALLRCDDPAFASADELVRHAERLDRVELLDRAARALVAREVGRLPPGVQAQVNVHARTLAGEDLFEASDPLFARSDRVTIEITERKELGEVTDLAERVARLRRLGYRIAIDNLGGGWAGLANFATVVPDVVKFGRELIRRIDRSPTKAKVVESLVQLCRGLAITTVAEGIETPEERRCATELGCDQLQGFLICRPGRLPR